MKGEQPTMKARLLLIAGIFAAATLPACVVPPKILITHHYRGEDKTSKILIMENGQINPATKKRLFDVLVRMCDLDPQGNETSCKDTKVVDNILPGSVY